MKAKEKPMRLLHVVLSMGVGGAEKLVYDMVRHPTFADCRPVIACLDSLADLGEKLREEGYTVYVKNRKEGVDLGVIPWLRGIMRREKITVVHAHQYTPLFYTVPAALLAGRVKVVYTEHGRFYPDGTSWKRKVFNPFLALGVDHLVSISAATAEAMATYDNLPRHRIKVIHNGVDTSSLGLPIDLMAKLREIGLNENCRIIGTAARLNKIKNIPMMLRVTKLVLKEFPDVYLVIAGQGEEEDRLKQLVAEVGVAERVKFIGLRFDMPEIYRLFDIFVLTSFSEGISVTLLEAMGTGVPAVVTNVGGNSEIVLEGKTGFLVPVDADAEMADRVTSLLTNHYLSHQLGLRGQERVRRHFSFSGMIINYLAIYQA